MNFSADHNYTIRNCKLPLFSNMRFTNGMIVKIEEVAEVAVFADVAPFVPFATTAIHGNRKASYVFERKDFPSLSL